MIRVSSLLLIAASLLPGQPKAQISGFVRDRSAASIRDASVAVLNVETGVRRSTRTNAEGFYALSSLGPGAFKVTVRKEGFQTAARVGLVLQATEAGRADFTLDIGSVHEVVTVESGLPIVNTGDASTGVVMGRNPAEAIPLNGRALQGLLELAPGVLATPATAGEAGQFSANGQRPNTNYFTVDGVSANNGVSGSGLPGQFSGSALPAMTAIGSLHNLVSLAELQELRVQTSTLAPEFGRLPGAQVAVSTRSGSNAFHGELFGSFRHERLAARDWFAESAGLDRVRQRLIDIGGSAGGPILPNRTFFFGSLEHVTLRQPVTFRTPVPTEEELQRSVNAPYGWALQAYGRSPSTAHAVSPAKLTTSSVRVDHALGDAGSLFVRYNRTPSRNRFGYYQLNDADFRSQTVTVGAVHMLGSRVTSDARVGVSRTAVESSWLPGVADVDLRSYLPPPPGGQQLYGFVIRGYNPLLTGDPGYSRQTQWNIVDTLSFTSGRHDVRIGIDYQRLRPRREQAISSVTVLFDSTEDLLAGRTPTTTFAQTGGGASLIETFSTFVQDTWHATSRLNLTYGLRWELTPPPSYSGPPMRSSGLPEFAGTASETPFWRTRYTQFAPRIGAAYRLTDQFVVRAGGGVFYDLGFSSATDLVNGGPYNRWRNVLAMAAPPGAETVSYGFAPDLRLPYSLEWNVTLERALSGDSAASVGYVGSAGRRLLRREAYPDRTLVLATNNGRSSYHSLQMQYRSRNYRGLQGTVSYTWAHAIDNGSWDSAAFVVPGNDRGSANFDVRHSFQAALAQRLRGGWLLSGVLRLRTGFPIDVVSSENAFGMGYDNDVRPDLVPGVPVWIADPGVPGGRRLNPAAFARPPGGKQGNLGRNSIEGLGLAQLDLALGRDFRMSERATLQFRLETYNVTNRANFADPLRFLSSSLFGTSPSLTNLMLGSGRPNSGLTPAFQSGGPRMAQLSLTLRF